MADVFISYASEDRNRVRPLAEALQQRGFSVWWDRSLAAGQDYASVIERELNAAKAVIVVWTESSAASTFVRDEAGRARDEGRLVPVLLDRVNIPLGFGAFQAEDFSRWNGGSEAPQMQILEEALKAKLEGRDADGVAIARKRRRLMGRVRIVSLLTVVFLIVGIAVGLNTLFKPEPEVQQADLRAELLRLLAEGQLTPEQAIQLATILEAGALGEAEAHDATIMAENEETAGAPAAPGAAMTRSARAEDADDVQLASVSEAEFDAAARETYREAMQQLLTHPDSEVRTAAARLGNPQTRDSAMQTLWAKAEAGDQRAEAIYQVCGAVGTANNNPLGARALEAAASAQPQDRDAWRMLSYAYHRESRTREAAAAAMVGEGVAAQEAGETDQAEARLQQALPNLAAPAAQAVVASELGEIAESRQDWGSASARFAEAYRLREEAAAQSAAPAPVQESLRLDAQRLITALDRSGRTRQACERLRQAQEDHDVDAPDPALVERCRTQYRVLVRPQVQVAPRPSPTLQTAPTRTAPPAEQ